MRRPVSQILFELAERSLGRSVRVGLEADRLCDRARFGGVETGLVSKMAGFGHCSARAHPARTLPLA